MSVFVGDSPTENPNKNRLKMSILKSKIARARKACPDHKIEDSFEYREEPAQERVKPTQQKKADGRKNKRRPREPGTYVTSERDRATKNIVKNYGKAICSFACSEIGKPYLETVLEKHNIKQHKEFLTYISKVKESIDSIQSFRSLLLVREDDPADVVAFKKAFAAIGEVFIKYFSVNWIFSGRITHKDTHLKFRFKMLRRIQHPEFFTYLKQGYQKNF